MTTKDKTKLIFTANSSYNIALEILRELEREKPDYGFVESLINSQIEKYTDIKIDIKTKN